MNDGPLSGILEHFRELSILMKEISMYQSNYIYNKKELPTKFGKYGYVLTGAGLILVVLSFIFDPLRATFNSLIVFTFLMGLGLCSLLLIAIEYLSGAVWSVPFRRIAEFLAPLIFIAPVFAIPAIINIHDVFLWAHPGVLDEDTILKLKSPYLNETFMLIRLAAIIIIMLIFAWRIIGNSSKQDKNPDQKFTKRNIRLSAIFIPFFAVSITIIAVDWIMSLEPHWFSTIFGVYFFAGSLVTTFSTVALLSIMLKNIHAYPSEITKDHFYNHGAFIFAFVNFWA
jgi:hypothetical protein